MGEFTELFVRVVGLADTAATGLGHELLVGALDPFFAISDVRETSSAESKGDVGGDLLAHV